MRNLTINELSHYHAGKDAWGEWKKGFCEGAGFALAAFGFANLGASGVVRFGMAAAGAAEYVAC